MLGVLVAAVLALSPSSADASCLATARAAVSTTKVVYPNLASSTSRVKPSELSTVICFDFTGDGRRDIAFSVFSGGTAGDIAWGILVGTGDVGMIVAITRSGYKLNLKRTGRNAVVTQPVYKADDPNCCPTAGFDHVAYRWSGKSFAVARRWHTKTFDP